MRTSTTPTAAALRRLVSEAGGSTPAPVSVLVDENGHALVTEAGAPIRC